MLLEGSHWPKCNGALWNGLDNAMCAVYSYYLDISVHAWSVGSQIVSLLCLG